jgi:glycosyltransferase involved in cell wall biosynthesis
VLELARLIWQKIQRNRPESAPAFEYVSDPPYPHDVQMRVPDVSKATKVLLGFEAKTGLSEVLDEVIPWIRQEISLGPSLTAELAAPPKLKPRYSVVVPVYNEAANIGAFCAEAKAKLPPGYELLICYDFDEDNTLPALEALPAAAKPPVVRLVHNKLGRGVRFAIEAGMRAAEADIVLVTMADLSDDFSNVEEMIQPRKKGPMSSAPAATCAAAARSAGRSSRNSSAASAGLTLKWFAGMPTHDPTNSFKAYRREFLLRTPIESEEGFCLGLELTVKAHFGGGRVEEVPATWQDRTAGDSRFQLKKWLPLYLHWYIWAMREQWLTRRSPVFVLGFLAAGLAFALSVFVPWSGGYPGGDLDMSWAMVLHWAHIHHSQFGKDIAFTYGPLGFVALGYNAQTFGYLVLGWSLMGAAFFCGVLRLTRQVTKNTWFRGLWAIVMTAFVASSQDVQLFSLTTLLLLLYWFDGDMDFTPLTLLLGLALAVAGLMKFSTTLMTVGVLGVITIDQLRRRKIPWPLLIFAAGYMSLWAWSGQSFASLFPYWQTSMSVAGGYPQGEGISLPTETADVVYFILCALPLIVMAAFVVWRSPGGKMRFFAPAVGLALILGVIFKAGYVRHDTHELEGAAGLAMVALLVGTAAWKRMDHPFWMSVAATGVVAPLILTWCVFERWNSISLPGQMISAVTGFPGHMQSALAGRSVYDTQYEMLLKGIRDAHPLPAITSSVDVYPWEQDIAIAYNMDYHPRPVFQSYVAYTPELEQMNADHLTGSDAPGSILFDVATIDGDYPSSEDALSWPQILTHYDLKQTEQSMLVMQRAPEDRSFALTPLSHVDADFGQVINVPSCDDPVWVHIDFRPTLWGRLASAMDKPPIVGIVVRTQGAGDAAARLVPETAPAGFLLSPLIMDRMSFALLTGTDWATELASKKVTSFKVVADTPDNKTAAYQSPVTVTFERLQFPHREISSVPGIAEYAGFQDVLQHMRLTTPPNVKAKLIPAPSGGGRVVLVTFAPSDLITPVPAGATHVRIKFGIMNQAFENIPAGERPTDGVIFAVIPMHRDDTGRLIGSPAWTLKLDPTNNPKDRGILEADVPLGDSSPEAVALLMRPGPHHINPFSYWAGVMFH